MPACADHCYAFSVSPEPARLSNLTNPTADVAVSYLSTAAHKINMNYRDQWATDEEGNRFVFTVEMQRQLQAAGRPAEIAEWLRFRREHAPASAPSRQDYERSGGRERPGARTGGRPAVAERDVDPATGKYIGVFKSYHADKGFGFIDQGNGQDIYFHKRRALDDPAFMNVGQRLLYNIDTYRGKEEAVDVEEM